MDVPRAYLDTSCWMKNIGDLIELHETKRIELVSSEEVQSELTDLKDDPARAERALRALSGLEDLGIENLYWPRPALGLGRLGEIRLGDSGRINAADFPSEDKDVAEYAIAGVADFAKQGRITHFLTDDKKLLRWADLIRKEAPGLEMLSLEDFRAELRRTGNLGVKPNEIE